MTLESFGKRLAIMEMKIEDIETALTELTEILNDQVHEDPSSADQCLDEIYTKLSKFYGNVKCNY